MDQNSPHVADEDVSAAAELGQLVAENVIRTGVPLDPDAITFDALLNVDYTDCVLGACAPPTVMSRNPRPEMVFWDADKMFSAVREHGGPMKVTARTCTLLDRALRAAVKHSRLTEHVMAVSYHYTGLPGWVGGTEVLIVDEPEQANVRHLGNEWRFVA